MLDGESSDTFYKDCMQDLLLEMSTEDLVDYCIQKFNDYDNQIKQALSLFDKKKAYEDICLIANEAFFLHQLINSREHYVRDPEDDVHYERWRLFYNQPEKHRDATYNLLRDLKEEKHKGDFGLAVEYSVSSYESDGKHKSKKIQQQIEKINTELDLLGAKFTRNYYDYLDSQIIQIQREEDRSAFPTEIQNEMRFGINLRINEPTVDFILNYHPNERIRKEAYEKYYAVIEENIEIAKQILTLRKKKASLLGYKSYSHYATEGYNVENPDVIQKTFNHTAKRFRKRAAIEEKALLHEFGLESLTPYNRQYYLNLYKNKNYDYDISDYLDGWLTFDNALEYFGKLFGMRFEKTNQPTWHDDVVYYEAYEGKELIGGFYADLFYRDGKVGGAWVDQIRYRTKTTLPVFVFMTNTRNTLDTSDVGVLLHELGHLFHGLLNRDEYAVMSGLSSLNDDLVEWPSQFIEHFASDAKTMSKILRHKETNKSLPLRIARIFFEGDSFGRCLSTLSYIEKSVLDINIHRAGKIQKNDLNNLYDKDYRCYISGFLHAFAYDGYCARYYIYLWSDFIARDSFEYAKENHLPSVMKAFRDAVLRKTGESSQKLFKKFAGRRHNTKAWHKYYLPPAR